MAEFPKLKTGAVAQYPMMREVRVRTRVLPFIDGTEQRYLIEKPLRRWVIRLDALDEGEAVGIDEFVRRHLETLESFAFTDPWSGVTYPQCVVEGSGHGLAAASESTCGLGLIVAEEAG